MCPTTTSPAPQVRQVLTLPGIIPPSTRLTHTYFHWMLFLDFFSISPIPSSTLVMS